MASLILGNIGSALLGPVGGFLGSALGSYIDNLLFAPKPPDIEGPRLDDLSAIQADPGVPIPLVWGADRTAGIVVHTTDLIETKHKKKVGGKGGGKRQLQITYTYHVDIDYMLCEGPILGVGRIWADGKIIRGTRYQMDLDTDAYYEQIGGIPYNSWYKDHIYDPSETPWSYDPTYTPTIEPQKYRWYSDGQGFVAIDDTEAQRLLDETKVVVYAYDSGSERMLPIPLSHDYTGEILDTSGEGGGGSIPGFATGRSSTRNLEGFGSGNPQDGIAQTTYMPISVAGGPVNPANPEYVGIVEGSITISGENTPLGGDHAWGIYGSIQLRVLGPDSNGNLVSAPESLALSDGFGSTARNVTLYANARIFKGASIVEITVNGARTSPALSDGYIMGGEVLANWNVPFSYYDPGPEVRDWPEYYNFYDAINDWSPKAVLEFHGPEGVALYRGTSDQIADPTMQLVVPGAGEAILADPDDEDAEDDFTVAGVGEVPAYRNRAHIVFQRLELEDFGNRIPNLTFETVQSDDARIKPVLTDLMNRAGIDPKYYDIDALPDEGIRSYMLGYSIGKVTSFRAAMEPLLESFKVDAAEIGDQIVFRPKVREYDYTIDYMDLATIDVGSGPEAPIRLAFRDVVEMPKSLGIRYKDPEREYQVNTAMFTRQIGRSIQASTLELPAVLAPSLMKALVRDKMRDLWLERVSGSWTLPHKYSYISPTDICKINGSDYEAEDSVFKVTKVTRRDTGILEMEGVLRETTLYVAREGETEDNATTSGTYTPQVNTPPATRTIGELMNLPPLLESHDDGGFYWAATGQASNWPGAALYRNEATEALPLWEALQTTNIGAPIGVTRQTRLPATNSWAGIDLTTTIDVYLDNPSEELESVTDYQLFNGANTALIGDEIICFGSAVQIDTNGWRLSKILRGRRGTEWAINNHQFQERFVFLSPDVIQNRVEETSTVTAVSPDLLEDRSYRFVTIGTTLANQTIVTFKNIGERLRPFAPVHLSAREDSGDIVFEWVRQDRLNFDFTASGEIPNSETSETYHVKIAVSAIGAEDQLREFEVVGSTSVTYTAAQIAEDGLTGLGFQFEINQVSSIVGDGHGALGVYNAS